VQTFKKELLPSSICIHQGEGRGVRYSSYRSQLKTEKPRLEGKSNNYSHVFRNRLSTEINSYDVRPHRQCVFQYGGPRPNVPLSRSCGIIVTKPTLLRSSYSMKSSQLKLINSKRGDFPLPKQAVSLESTYQMQVKHIKNRWSNINIKICQHGLSNLYFYYSFKLKLTHDVIRLINNTPSQYIANDDWKFRQPERYVTLTLILWSRLWYTM